LKATITLEYDEEQTAAAIANAVSPDNFEAPAGLVVKTELKGNRVVTDITLDGKTSTFIATIEDLLSCVSTAERILHVVKKK
jgi:tRNA threonylcarbamoyladenosine modification (KEOPS) complex  Pcc1 subunit